MLTERSSTRGPLVGVVTALIAAALLLVAMSGSALATAGYLPDAVAKDGARVIKETPVDGRLVDLSIQSPALHGVGLVRLMLPLDWSSHPKETWPTLYMLEGAGEPKDYTSWTSFTDYETFMLDKNVLSVLPTGGLAGYTSAQLDGGPNYDKFTAVELPQILKRAYRSDGVHNAIAGLSTGGLGAIDLAANYPGQYTAAASYSGLLDTEAPGVPLFIADSRTRDQLSYTGLWGTPTSDPKVWAEHNPTDLVSKLKHVRLFVSCGNGAVGPLDNPAALPPLAGYLEGQTYTTNQDFLTAAGHAGFTTSAATTPPTKQVNGVWPIQTDLYGPGTHTWPYWQAAFQASWPMLAAGLGVPAS